MGAQVKKEISIMKMVRHPHVVQLKVCLVWFVGVIVAVVLDVYVGVYSVWVLLGVCVSGFLIKLLNTAFYLRILFLGST